MKKDKNTSQNPIQDISEVKGRAMLEWYGKQAPKSIEWFPAQEKEVYGDLTAKEWNKIFWGDNKQVLAHLLKEYRGKIDLIYIDPPFDSKADYVKKVKLKGQKIEGVAQGVLEEMQYTDIWEKDEYLQFIYERLIIMRELLSEKGSFYLHADYHRGPHIKLILDEVFGEENFLNEIIWHHDFGGRSPYFYARKHDNIYLYHKGREWTFNIEKLPDLAYQGNLHKHNNDSEKSGKKPTAVWFDIPNETDNFDNVWDIAYENKMSLDNTNYPTQKPKELLQRIIEISSNEGDLIMDCFMGSGTTLAVAQKLGRRWIGCDINKGAIITTTERLNKIISQQTQDKKLFDEYTGALSFKVYNVNNYDVFNNDIQAKELLMQAYKIEELARGDFDGLLGVDYVKIISPNRVLSKLDIREVIDAINNNKDKFTVRKTSKQGESTYENKVIVICSGAELDVRDFVKKENKTGVEIEIRDIQVDKKELNFKRPTEAVIEYTANGKTIDININDYYSPLLMQRLELENENRLSMEERVTLFDFRQAIEHIAIDINYGEGQKDKTNISFNAEAFLHKAKKDELVDIEYSHTYKKTGKYTIAIKIVDVLGEEYFETHEIEIK